MKPNVLVDSGCENINGEVDVLVDSESISLTIAQIDIEQSNSMVEMLFHRMKHRYLFTIFLSNFESLVKGTDFYLNESNTFIPLHETYANLLMQASCSFPTSTMLVKPVDSHRYRAVISMGFNSGLAGPIFNQIS